MNTAGRAKCLSYVEALSDSVTLGGCFISLCLSFHIREIGIIIKPTSYA